MESMAGKFTEQLAGYWREREGEGDGEIEREGEGEKREKEREREGEREIGRRKGEESGKRSVETADYRNEGSTILYCTYTSPPHTLNCKGLVCQYKVTVRNLELRISLRNLYRSLNQGM